MYDNTKEEIDRIVSMFFTSTTSKFLFVYILHYTFSIVPILLWIIYPSKITRWWNFFFIGFVVLSNFYFNGCIILKMERQYLNDKKWYGFYHILETFGIELTNQRIQILTFFYFLFFLVWWYLVCYCE